MVPLTETTTYHRVTSASTELPVTLDMVRAHLRAEDIRDDDALVVAYIQAAVDRIERMYSLALLTQTIEQVFDRFPSSPTSPILLRVSPLVSVTSVAYIDTAGNTQTWSASEYASANYNGTAFVVPKQGYEWPIDVCEPRPDAVKVTYTAGFGAKASSIPKSIAAAICLYVGFLYANREDAPHTIPTTVDAIMRPFYPFSIH